MRKHLIGISVALAAMALAILIPSAHADDAIVTPLGDTQLYERVILVQSANELVGTANDLKAGGFLTQTEEARLQEDFKHLGEDFDGINTAGATGDRATFDKLIADALETEGSLLASMKKDHDEGVKTVG